jgi:hypothetical protein
VTQVVEANLYRETGLLEESPKRVHHGVAPADLAFRVREDEAGIAAQEVEGARMGSGTTSQAVGSIMSAVPGIAGSASQSQGVSWRWVRSRRRWS